MPVWAAVPIIAGVVAKGLQVGLDAWESRDLGDKGFEIVARVAEFNVEDRQSSCFSNVKEGVPQHIVDSCCNGLSGAWVTVSGSPSNGVSIAGLPYDCIPLAPWIDGTGSVPYACGDDCIKYDGLTQDEYNALKNAFESKV
ncbi:uncharacterized protein J7T54_007916 [Emericellopsis cladophorae]|uniref:Uncharacterized protein n=1 Tax=Emericellopsis cladophorae TaxID=2686198 RepID=A0A9P9Y821_9HYPO|nr:uncharacterized protein J7T54_007916 [Emericellopsis cladophorae]KAI6784823.1 hypothetical protein J7T54_007916 [Emericellopsis cladophorae]